MKCLINYMLLIGVLIFSSGNMLSQKTISEHVDKLGKRYVKSRKNHALVIGIIREGETAIKSYGQLCKKNKAMPDGNSVFEIGAATSVFTTTLMQIQSDNNHFRQKEPVYIYLEKNRIIPAYHPLKCVDINLVVDVIDKNYRGQNSIYSCYEDPHATAKCISFCDLATHISGLPASPKGWYKWKPMGINKLENSFTDKTVEQFFKHLQEVKLGYVPGIKFHHSDFGIALLGNAISEIAELSFDSLLTKELLQPLGMENTHIASNQFAASKIVHGHNRRGKPVAAWNFDAMAPAAGLKSTMNDLLKFAQANLETENQDLENAFVEVQQNKVDVTFGKNGRTTSMGYGWCTSILNDKSNLPVIWINGGTGGFRTFIGFIKDSKTAVVVLSNSARSVDKMGFKILEILNASE